MGPHAPSSTARILVADDEPVIAETLRLILQQDGYEVTAVANGRAAVETARTWPPQIFLSDVVMPLLNGIEAAIQIKAMYPGCRIVLLSGQAATLNLLSEARTRGHDFEIISKPIHPSHLLDLLRGLPA